MKRLTDRLLSLRMVAFTIIALFLFVPMIQAEAYTVFFETYGGTYINDVHQDEPGLVTRPEDPVWEEHEFAGWYQDDTYNVEFDFDNVVVDRDTTIYAKWNTIIEEGRVYVTIPVAGVHPVHSGMSDDSESYTVAGVNYYLNDELLDDNYTFEPDTTYAVYVEILPGERAAIDTQNTIMHINNYNGVYFGYSAGKYVYKLMYTVPEAGVTQISTDIVSAFYPDMIEGFESEESDNYNYVVRVTNTGSTSVRISMTNPSQDGPFGNYVFDEDEVLNPNDFMDITLRLSPSSPYANTPGNYSGNHVITATNVDDAEDTYETNVNVNVNVLAYEELTVTFDSNGGSAVGPLHPMTGETIAKPADPTWEGHVFLGWCLTMEDEYPFDFENTKIYTNTTLLARWAEAVPITMVSVGNDIDPIETVVPRGAHVWAVDVEFPSTPTKYVVGFKLNSPDGDFLTNQELMDYIFDEEVVIYVFWEDCEIIPSISISLSTSVAGRIVGYTEDEFGEYVPTAVPDLGWDSETYGVFNQLYVTSQGDPFVGTIENGQTVYFTVEFLAMDEYAFNADTLENITIENATVTNAILDEEGKITVTGTFTATEGGYMPPQSDFTVSFDAESCGEDIGPFIATPGQGVMLPILNRENYVHAGYITAEDVENENPYVYPAGQQAYFFNDVTLYAVWYPIENKITSIELEVDPPFAGYTNEIEIINDEYGETWRPTVFPDARVSEQGAHYHLFSSRWINSLCDQEHQETCMDDFEGTFVTGQDYYVLLEIEADHDYFMETDVLDHITINGEAPAEVFTVYSKTYTMVIARLTAIPEFYTVRFMDGENEMFSRNIRYREQVERPNPNPINGIYIVEDWYSDDTLNTLYTFESPITNNVDIFAKMVVNKQAMASIEIGGANIESMTIADGDDNTVTVSYLDGNNVVVAGSNLASEISQFRYYIYALGDITVTAIPAEHFNGGLMENGEILDTMIKSYTNLQAGDTRRIDGIFAPEGEELVPIVPEYDDDIEFDIHWENVSVEVKMNKSDVIGEESEDFSSHEFTYNGVIVHNGGTSDENETNVLRFRVRFGDHPVTTYTINGVDYTEESENVEIVGDVWNITVPGASKYTISGVGDESINPPRTIIWANVGADEHAEDYAPDMLVEHAVAKVVGVYNEDNELVTGETEANEQGMGWIVVNPGDRVLFEFVPEYGYQMTSISANGSPLAPQDTENQYSFQMPNTNIHFAATFAKIDDVVATNTEKVESGEISLGNGELTGGTAKLTISDVELSNDKIKGFEEAAGDYTLKNYLDIDLYNIFYKGKDDADDVWSNKIDELQNEATITIKLADDVDVSNVVLVHNVHDGETYEIIQIESYDQANHTITFKTKSFSNYAIALKETTTEEDNSNTNTDTTTTETNKDKNPKTNDNIIGYVIALGLSIICLVIMFVGYRKAKKDNA